MRVATLTADLVANSTSFESSLQNADRAMMRSKGVWSNALKTSEQGFNSLSATVGKVSKAYGVLAGVASAAAGAGMVMIARNALTAAGALNDTARRLQITTDELQKYNYAAKLSGLSSEELESALTKLNAKIADGEFKYKSTTEALESIAEAVRTAKTDFERTAIVNDAFGNKMGAKLIPVLMGGAEGLRALGDEAERTGNVIRSNIIQAADDFADKMDILGATIKNNFQAGFLESFVTESKDLRDIYADPQFAEGIKEVGTAIGDLTALTLNAVAALGKLIGAYREANEAGDRWAKKQDQKFFDFLDNIDRKLGRGALVGDPSQRQYGKREMYGPFEQFGPPAPKATAAGVTPYTPSKATKEADTAAKKAEQLAQKRIDQTNDIINGLKLESEQLSIQTSMYGKKESAIARAQKQLIIENQLRQAGIQLTEEQRQAITQYLDSIERQTELQGEQEKQQKRLEEAERDRQQAINQLGASFESAFENAIVSGDKLSDVLDGLLQDIVRILTRVTITAPISNAITDAFTSSSGSGGGGFLDGLFDFLPSFDVGTNRVPRDMIAQIHQGEEIVPAWAANKREGGGAGGDVVVNIINNNGSQVSQRQTSGPEGPQIEVMIDQAVADNINQRGTRTNQALQAFANRGLVRR